MAVILVIIYLAVIIAAIAGMWQAFVKAGAPGWGCLIPFYNIYLLTKMADKPAWWVVLALIPLVNIVVFIIMSMEVAKGFAKSGAFGVGLALLGFIFWPILGFGDATWRKAPVGS